MKRWIIVVVVVLIAGLAGLMRATMPDKTQTGRHNSPGREEVREARARVDEAQAGVEKVSDDESSEEANEAREEKRESYPLQPGAEVEVAGINGLVLIETADISTAEVHTIRTARDKEDLEQRRITIEHTPKSLVIRGEDQGSGGFWRMFRRADVHQRVELKLPRQIELSARGINGRTTIGEVNGRVEVHGINGKVDIAQATSESEITGVNGGVAVTVKQLSAKGLRISGINGGVELRLSDNLNADFTGNGINGKVGSDIPDVTVQGEPHGRRYRAKIGEGGAPIKVTGINGGVRLTRGAAANTNTANQGRSS